MNSRRVRAAQADARGHLERLADEIDALPSSAPDLEQAMSCLLLGAGAVEFGDTIEQVRNGAQLAIAGLYLTRGARVVLGIVPGPQPPPPAPAPKKSRQTP